MGDLINNITNGYSQIARGINEAAFGDVRNLFNNTWVASLMGRRIGLIANSYDFLYHNLRRNIGNSMHSYDGFGTPIGGISDPYFNSFFGVPWFFLNGEKNSTANYLEYVRATYGATISVENINKNYDLRIIGNGSSVGAVQITNELLSATMGDAEMKVSLINPNGAYTDTMLGIASTYYAAKTLNNAITFNNLRTTVNAKNFGITDDLKQYFGLKTQAIGDKHLLDISTHYVGESFLSAGYYHNDALSPVYNTNYGVISDIGVYRDYVMGMSEDTLYHFHYNSQLNVTDDEIGRFTILDASEHDGGVGLQYGRRYLPTPHENYFAIAGVAVTTPSFTFDKQKKSNSPETYADLSNIRYTFESESKTVFNAPQGGVFVYTEEEDGKSTDIYGNPLNSGIKFGIYSSYGYELNSADNLLRKTNIAFKHGQYDTLIARFKSGVKGKNQDVNDAIQTAISKEYGMSHGRNLLKNKENQDDESQGYNNPYCRVWTFHHQYHRLADAIRPFQEKDEKGTHVISQTELYDEYGFNVFSADHSKKGFEDGRTRLGKYGVLNQRNGLVNITPIDSGDPNKKVDIKNCMFSIENLAWKDSFSSLDSEMNTFQNGGLSSEQKGPFGGRIMWFPPYGLKFNETVNVDWSQNNFIGRGESIYTYKNTTRSGQLSFKLLIDHPSIINYWENRGKSVSNSVDDVNDPEQQLLRFFAGCELLTSKSAEKKKVDTVFKDEVEKSPNTDVFTFFVFYPNDYSGVGENDNNYAIEYLLNGIGTWRLTTWNVGNVKFYSEDDAKEYCDEKLYSYSVIKEKYGEESYHPAFTFCNAHTTINGDFSFRLRGGYEIRVNDTLSLMSSIKVPNDYLKTFIVAKYGEEDERYICTQIGPSSEHVWDCKWYYRVDSGNSKTNRTTEKLKLQNSYFDTHSFGLNSKNGKQSISDEFNVDKEKLFSFTEMFIAFESSNYNSANSVLAGTFDYNSIKKIKDIFSKKEKIKEIVCIGQASVQGNSSPESKNVERNKELAKQRAETIQKWLIRKTGLKNVRIETISPQGEKTKDVSDKLNKLHRCVRVDIYVEREESKVVQDIVKEGVVPDSGVHPEHEIIPIRETVVTRPSYPSRNGLGIPTSYDYGSNVYYDNATLEKKKTYEKLSSFGKSIDYLTFNLGNSYENGHVNVNGVFHAINNFAAINNASNDLALNYVPTDIINIGDEQSNDDGNQGGKKSDDQYYGKLDPLRDREKELSYDKRIQEVEKIKRYDMESKFFEMLEVEEPFLHHKISDKVKYFDPAFHSISPEGFNARLTFLQQCSRQGPTCASSDPYTKNNTANNLSFGRPPVCILRIGDFYYTKIIIDSIAIDFGDVMWDLNAEGIGVMPMIADINISFKYIGGSSLSGPISRLQNALSFNAYANTEVYDNRAELAEYDNNGNLTKFGANPID